ncbi:ChaN family lipoprotein [Desulfovibrio inopinatus]|uniref:ChaN family lipoprotein n=1 Tax=Desulfovibrio inopinatus TaxID=102109 RepID=UPI000687775B|nr:ChaN family lipoprotein [Desulfovibrio inopinatus]
MGLNRKTVHYLFAFSLLLTGGCATARPPALSTAAPTASSSSAITMTLPDSGTFVRATPDSSDGFTRLAPQELLDQARHAAYLLLGEVHTNACDHAMQADFLKRLGQAGVSIAVGLEMVSVDLQPVLDDFNAGRLSIDQLPQALDWEHTWGYDFSLYRPIFETAAQYGYPLYALNLPKGLARKYGKVGIEGLPPQERAFLPAPVLPAPDAQKSMLEDQFKAHMSFLKNRDNAPNLDRFIRVQSAWDTTMATEAARVHASTHRPVAIIVGNGHVEYGYGIAHRLKTLDPTARALLVMPWRGQEAPDPKAGDIFFYCPLLHRSRLGYTLSEIDNSLHVITVAPQSPAEHAGLMQDDVILTANDIPITSLADLHKAAITASKNDAPLVYTVKRGSETVDVTIKR